MKVRITYYIYFWLINSLMAFGTGIIMGLVAMRVFTMMFNKTPDPEIIRISTFIILITPLCFLFVFQLIVSSFFWGKRRGEFEYAFLAKSAQGKKEPGERLKKINQELRCCDQNSAYSKLQDAIKIYPDNFVIQFKYAISCERVGQAKDAIAAYERALKLIPESSEALTVYVNNQINRVKIKGPLKGAAIPGLKYILW